MRFLILTQYYPPEVGAAQLRLAAFGRELVRAGHEVEVVTALPNYPSGRLRAADRGLLRRRETSDGIPVTRLWLYPATGTGIRRLVSYLSFTLTGGIAATRARKPDIVFVESPPLFLGVAGWLIARRFGAAFVLNVSDLWPDSVRDVGAVTNRAVLTLAESLERWLYERATAVTAVTQGIRERLLEVKGVPAERVLLLTNGVDTELFQPVEAPGSERGRTRPLILYTGNQGVAQGLEVIIRAAALTPEVDWTLIGDGSARANLVRDVAAQDLTNVQFEDPIPPAQVAARYASAIAGVVSLRGSVLMAGARPAKLLAIMACGRPVLYSGAGEGADLVREAGAGLVVPPEDPRALADAAMHLASSPIEAAAMGAAGRRFVEREFSWRRNVDSWLSQLGDVVGGVRR